MVSSGHLKNKDSRFDVSDKNWFAFQNYAFPKQVLAKCSILSSNTMVSIGGDIEDDGSIYDRPRNPPGQRSVYIPPGDTFKESYRLSTFIKFPQNCPVNPRLLASSGFFYTGYKDQVKCFSCGLCVENWVVGDDVTSSRWHRENCQMKLQKDSGNEPIGRIFPNFDASSRHDSDYFSDNLSSNSVGISTSSSTATRSAPANYSENNTASAGSLLQDEPRVTVVRTRNHPMRQTARPVRPSRKINENLPRIEMATIQSVHHEQFIRSLDFRKESDTLTVRKSENQNIALSPGERPPVPRPIVMLEPPDPSQAEQRDLENMFPCLMPASAHMRNEDSRFDTFDERWPASQIRASPRQISRAGFFFLGDRDRVKCWYCNGSLQNWDPDDEPWTEHAKWFPTCEFLLGKKLLHRIACLSSYVQRPVFHGPEGLPSKNIGITQHFLLPSIINLRVKMKRTCNQENAVSCQTVETAIEVPSAIHLIMQKKSDDQGETRSAARSLTEDLLACHDSLQYFASPLDATSGNDGSLRCWRVAKTLVIQSFQKQHRCLKLKFANRR